MARLSPPRPLAADDDRGAFDCGRGSLNQWFRRHAWRNQESGASRISVLREDETGVIVGYVSLSAAQIARDYLPKSARRNQPDPLPAILLGQLAIDQRHQGQGYARSLLFFALSTAVRLSREIGCFAVLTHPLDEGVRAFYRRYGFEDLPFDPRRSMIVRIVDLERNGF
ncbi:GCN5-related N-acetyltransferase [Nitrospirillum viridazoti Y2]|uniref:N-acetyltransferase YhbS n=1 Tax=Nitrospirillum amazonense TaxID=28077 RepID=A0A560HII8_9PROT|nr:GNAT family N-acetyltransferase [Nitrospirillum amazonense]EGX99792.1 GCN5-related N-acetyltransferase [Nitrospirillum amazonense Y2]TWB46265.1 putative N-acetyltransferase YhbS [Nitrospirillum amazonense]